MRDYLAHRESFSRRGDVQLFRVDGTKIPAKVVPTTLEQVAELRL